MYKLSNVAAENKSRLEPSAGRDASGFGVFLEEPPFLPVEARWKQTWGALSDACLLWSESEASFPAAPWPLVLGGGLCLGTQSRSPLDRFLFSWEVTLLKTKCVPSLGIWVESRFHS